MPIFLKKNLKSCLILLDYYWSNIMAETRLEKYRRYRESLNEVKANNEDEVLKESRRNRIVTDTTNTTSTLPLEEVLGKIDEESEDTSMRVWTLKKIKIGFLIILGILVVAGLIIFAVVAFGGKNV